MNARFMMNFIACLSFLTFCTHSIAKETVEVGGTGDSQSLLRTMAESFENIYPDIVVLVPDSIGSSGGVKAVQAGRMALGRIARPLTAHEKQDLLEIPFANSPVVFAVHPTVTGVENLTPAQILDIYAGKYRNWSELGGPNVKLYSIDREGGDSSRKVLKAHIPGFNDIDSKAKIFYSTPDAVEAIARHDFTIGYLPLALAKRYQLKVLSIDGAAPTKKNVIRGDYPYVTPFSLVSKGEPTGAAEKFVTFVLSEKGQRIISDSYLLPVR